MKTLQELLGHGDKFFDLLESSAKQAMASVQLLLELMKNPDPSPPLDEVMQARRKDKRITEQIAEELCRTFITPLEREDIEKLSVALYKIPKTVEKFSERFLLCRSQAGSHDFSRQLNILKETTETVATMVAMIRREPRLAEMKEHNDRLHCLEGEADRLMMELMKDLYGGRHNTLEVIVVTDLYDTLERIIDRCRDAGNVIFQIVLKYS